MADPYNYGGSRESDTLQMLLIEQQFGVSTSTVAKTMVMCPKTLKQIGELCPHLSHQVMKESITILLQHNLVAYASRSSRSSRSSGPNMYRLLSWRILQLARYPRLVQYTRDTYNANAEILIEELLLHGQMTLASLMESARDRIENAVSTAALHTTFNDLLGNHLVQRSVGLLGEITDPDILYERVPYEPQPDTDATPPRKRARTESSTKPKAESTKPKAVYWKANIAQFYRCLLCDMATAAIKAKLGAETADIFLNLVSICATDLQYHDSGRSRAIGIDELKESVAGSARETDYKKYLSVLINFGGGFVTEEVSFLTIDFNTITTSLRTRCLEEIILAKFSKMHFRLFRMVLKRGFVEQNQAKEFSLMGEKKVVKAHLNNLFSDQFLTLQEAPKRGERSAQQCYFFWTCDLHRVVKKQINRCYKAQTNLTLRVLRERGEVDALETKQTEVLASNKLDDLMEADQKRFRTNERKLDALRAKLKNLESGILEIDAQIMVLRDLDERPLSKRNPDHSIVA